MVKRAQNGFTTVELLVALTLAFMLAGFVSAAVYFAQKLSTQWQERMQVEAAALLCVQALQKDLWRAQQIVQADSQTFTLLDAEQRVIAYEYRAPHLYRNETRVASFALEIASCKMRYFKLAPEDSLGTHDKEQFEIFWPRLSADLANIVLLEITLTLRRKSTATIKVVLHPRRISGNKFNLR